MGSSIIHQQHYSKYFLTLSILPCIGLLIARIHITSLILLEHSISANIHHPNLPHHKDHQPYAWVNPRQHYLQQQRDRIPWVQRQVDTESLTKDLLKKGVHPWWSGCWDIHIEYMGHISNAWRRLNMQIMTTSYQCLPLWYATTPVTKVVAPTSAESWAYSHCCIRIKGRQTWSSVHVESDCAQEAEAKYKKQVIRDEA